MRVNFKNIGLLLVTAIVVNLIANIIGSPLSMVAAGLLGAVLGLIFPFFETKE